MPNYCCLLTVMAASWLPHGCLLVYISTRPATESHYPQAEKRIRSPRPVSTRTALLCVTHSPPPSAVVAPLYTRRDRECSALPPCSIGRTRRGFWKPPLRSRPQPGVAPTTAALHIRHWDHFTLSIQVIHLSSWSVSHHSADRLTD